jgi:hypothetical protein
VQYDDAIVSFEVNSEMRDLVVGEGQAEAALDHPLDQQTFHIRMANSEGRREAASLLLKKMYGWRGYSVDPAASHVPNKITLFAETGGETVERCRYAWTMQKSACPPMKTSATNWTSYAPTAGGYANHPSWPSTRSPSAYLQR